MHSIVSQHKELSSPNASIGVVEKSHLEICSPIFIENFYIRLELEMYILINKFYFKKCIYF